MFNKGIRIMFQVFIPIFSILCFMFVIQSCKKEEEKIPPPPESKVINVGENVHGVEIVDHYRWLEDQESPETREWIKEQNAYTDSILASLSGREDMKELVSKYIKIDTITTPVEMGGKYFFYKRKADQDLFIIYMREGLTGEDQILIDPHTMSKDLTTSVNIQDISRDGRLLAYGIRRGGEDEVEVRFMDVDAREDIEDFMPKGRYFGISFTSDKKGVYYSRHNPDGPRVFFHKLGDEHSTDKEIFGEGYGPETILYPGVSENGRWLVITVLYGSAADKTEIYLKDSFSDKPIFPVVNNIDARFEGQIEGDTLFLQTNWNAPKGRILVVNPENPAQENWREIIPESDAVLQGFSGAGRKLFLSYLEDVKTKVLVFEPDGSKIREISFPTIGTVSGMRGKWESDEAFYVFTSFHIPSTIYRYDVGTGKQEVWAKIEVPVESDRYEVRQVWYSSKDGTKVPMFILNDKGMKLDGSNPTLLTGYGGFNISLTPGFSSQAAAWIEKGGVYAVVNLRGGSEFGEEWHRAGMLENKQNVFDDFIAAAEYLIDNKYTTPEKLAIRGGSNGGLLVGAAMVQHPELFGAVVCTYPLLDMIRYHKFLVAKYWVSEYGSSDNPEQFKYIYDYSPYHHVKKGEKYPAVLFITGDADTRVAPLHARKMTALVQDSTGSDNPVMLRYHTKAGHSGGQPVSQQIEDLTDILSFLLWQLK